MGLEIPGTLLLDALAGSHAYGLSTPESDEDFRGVYAAPKKMFYQMDFPSEVSDESNDKSYFELSKFSELLIKSNPTVLEFLSYQKENLRSEHPLFSKFKHESWLSKRCNSTFVGYALGQIRKAYGLKKRINVPEDEKELSPFDFMEVIREGKLQSFNESGLDKKQLSVTDLVSEKEIYGLWKNSENELILDEKNNFLNMEKGSDHLGYLFFRRQEFLKYHKEYQSYFKWKKSQDSTNVLASGESYDGKFMMHTFRLLFMARDIAEKGELILVRPEREMLLKIKHHEFEFSDLIKQSEELIQEVKAAFKASSLPNEVDSQKAKDIAAEIRFELYH